MKIKRTIAMYLIITIILFLFQLIYHQFSHGVVSTGLKFVWLIPLIGGLLVLFLNHSLRILENRFAFNLYNIALALSINYLILQGILDIAGSDSPFLLYNLVLSGVAFSLSILLFFGHRLFPSK